MAALTFRDLAIGEAFSFPTPSLADRHGYVKRSARGWSHPTYGNGRVGSINVTVERATDPYDRAIAYAEAEGTRDGKAAASWYFDGNTPADAYARVLAGIEDGDPAVLNTFPYADLSGEWADTLTGPQLVRDAWWSAYPDLDSDDMDDQMDDLNATGTDAFSDICDAYETAFSTAVQDEISRVARYQVEP